MISIFSLSTVNHKLEKCLRAFLFISLKSCDSGCEARTTFYHLHFVPWLYFQREFFLSATGRLFYRG